VSLTPIFLISLINTSLQLGDRDPSGLSQPFQRLRGMETVRNGSVSLQRPCDTSLKRGVNEISSHFIQFRCRGASEIQSQCVGVSRTADSKRDAIPPISRWAVVIRKRQRRDIIQNTGIIRFYRAFSALVSRLPLSWAVGPGYYMLRRWRLRFRFCGVIDL
jgi:hypothetical protein